MRLNLKIMVEEMKEMGIPVNRNYSQSELEHLTMEIILSIEEMIRSAPGRKIEHITRDRTDGRITVNMLISADGGVAGEGEGDMEMYIDDTETLYAL